MKFKKTLGVMVGFDYEILQEVRLKRRTFLCFPVIPDKNKIFDGQTIYLYERSNDGTGCGKVVGETQIKSHYLFDSFPFQELFRYWASEIRCDAELVMAIDRIGSFRLSSYKPEYTYHLGLFDEEYLNYAKKYGKLPDCYGDYLHDYIHHPEHYKAREKARIVLSEYDLWLRSFSILDLYQKLNNKVFFVEIEKTAFYIDARSVTEYTAENKQKHFTRAPNGIMYTWDGKYMPY